MKILRLLTLALSLAVIPAMVAPVADAAPSSFKKAAASSKKPKKAGLPQGFVKGIDAAMKKAEKENLPVMVLFTNPPTCPYCVKLEEEVLNNAKWKSGSKKKFVGIYLDNANNDPRKGEFSQKYPCRGIPTYFWVKPDGTLISQGGYNHQKTPEDYLKELKTAADAVKKDAKAAKDSDD